MGKGCVTPSMTCVPFPSSRVLPTPTWPSSWLCSHWNPLQSSHSHSKASHPLKTWLKPPTYVPAKAALLSVTHILWQCWPWMWTGWQEWEIKMNASLLSSPSILSSFYCSTIFSPSFYITCLFPEQLPSFIPWLTCSSCSFLPFCVIKLMLTTPIHHS